MLKLKKITSVFFEYTEGVKFELRNLNSGDVSTIRDAGTTSRIEIPLGDGGNYEPKRVLESKQKAEDEATVVALVVNWEGVADDEGNALECTTANKIRLCRELDPPEFVHFIGWLHEKRREMEKLVTEQAEGSEKN